LPPVTVGSRSLPTVVGLFAGGQHVARADSVTDRVCPHCCGVAIADELHMIVVLFVPAVGEYPIRHECPVLELLQHRYAALCSTNTETVRSFIAQQDHMQISTLF